MKIKNLLVSVFVMIIIVIVLVVVFPQEKLEARLMKIQKQKIAVMELLFMKEKIYAGKKAQNPSLQKLGRCK